MRTQRRKESPYQKRAKAASCYRSFTAKQKVCLTNHVVERYIQRHPGEHLTQETAREQIIAAIANAVLLNLNGDEETLSYRGDRFICKRIKQGYQEKLIVITVLLNKAARLERFSDGCHIDYWSMGCGQKTRKERVYAC